MSEAAIVTVSCTGAWVLFELAAFAVRRWGAR
jgi:hypothetical protein